METERVAINKEVTSHSEALSTSAKQSGLSHECCLDRIHKLPQNNLIQVDIKLISKSLQQGSCRGTLYKFVLSKLN